jgi:hypothetical protein
MDQDFFKIIKQTNNRIFKRHTQHCIKVLNDPEAGPKCERVLMRAATPGFVAKEGQTTMAKPSKTKITERKRAIGIGWGGACSQLSSLL